MSSRTEHDPKECIVCLLNTIPAGRPWRPKEITGMGADDHGGEETDGD
jgi:hypothetical protein